jgi:serpin B
MEALTTIKTFNCAFEEKLITNILQSGKNLLISPFSIYLVLCLLSNGADGDTQKELLSLLDINSLSDHNKILQALLQEISNNKNGKIFKFANGIFTKVTPSKYMQDISNRIYQAEIQTLKSANQVNKWVAEKTNNKITNLIESANYDMILVSTLYFLGKWESKFDSKLTSYQPFYGKASTNNKCKFMNGTFDKEFLYYENEIAEFIELPYQGGNITARFFLPKNIDADELLKILISSDVNAEYVTNAEKNCKIWLSIPIFKLRLNEKIKDTLIKIGMTTSFTESADFSKLTHYKAPLYVDDILHQTLIEIHENGTEAAAVTVVKKMGKTCRKRRPQKK